MVVLHGPFLGLLLVSMVYCKSLELSKPKDQKYDIQDLPPMVRTAPVEFAQDQVWPVDQFPIGQVAGLATDKDGDLYIFHRADRNWEPEMFDDNTYFGDLRDPISIPTLLKVDKKTGDVLSQWGENKFFVPHGLTIDHEGNFWFTDVARHQVLKYKVGGSDPILTLGRDFEPAKSNYDMERFCKPADVAVAQNGDFFVADGYCNSRVLKFSANGTFLAQFGEDEFAIPHSLALAEDLDLLCVADREYQRIVCFNAGLKDASKFGEPSREFGKNSELGRVFSIEYKNGLLYGVNGTSLLNMNNPIGFIIDLHNDHKTGEVMSTFAPADNMGFVSPHALALSPDGKNIFVGEIGPNVVWKFDKK